jgi:hypothetical protein
MLHRSSSPLSSRTENLFIPPRGGKSTNTPVKFVQRVVNLLSPATKNIESTKSHAENTVFESVTLKKAETPLPVEVLHIQENNEDVLTPDEVDSKIMHSPTEAPMEEMIHPGTASLKAEIIQTPEVGQPEMRVTDAHMPALDSFQLESSLETMSSSFWEIDDGGLSLDDLGPVEISKSTIEESSIAIGLSSHLFVFI